MYNATVRTLKILKPDLTESYNRPAAVIQSQDSFHENKRYHVLQIGSRIQDAYEIKQIISEMIQKISQALKGVLDQFMYLCTYKPGQEQLNK